MPIMITDVHHLGLTVRDVDVSAGWYQRVLGFRRSGEWADPAGARRKVFLAHDGLRIRLGLVEHSGSSGDPFDETRTGLDHLAFAVADRAGLEDWCAHLSAQGVAFSPIAESNSIDGACVVVLRDPDNIQLELFADPGRSADR